jgi:hypothetical protein
VKDVQPSNGAPMLDPPSRDETIDLMVRDVRAGVGQPAR